MLLKKSFLLSFLGFSTSIPPCLRSTFVFCYFLSFPLSLPIHWAYPPAHVHTTYISTFPDGYFFYRVGHLKAARLLRYGKRQTTFKWPTLYFHCFLFSPFPHLEYFIIRCLLSIAWHCLFSDAFSFYFILFFCYQRQPKKRLFIFVFFPSRLLLISFILVIALLFKHITTRR